MTTTDTGTSLVPTPNGRAVVFTDAVLRDAWLASLDEYREWLIRRDVTALENLTKPAIQKGLDVLDGEQKEYVFETVTVPKDQYFKAIKESLGLAKTGVMRLVLLPGQEHESQVWESAQSPKDGLFRLVQPAILEPRMI